MSKPNLDELVDELAKYQGDTSDPNFQLTYPDLNDVKDFAEKKGVDLTEAPGTVIPRNGLFDKKISPASYSDAIKNLNTASQAKPSKTVLGYEVTKSMPAAVSPELAAKAEIAIMNAAAGGGLMAAGLEIDGQLTVKVHDFVHLDYKDSHIKTTVKDTTYTHKDNVNIYAKNVRLTAQEIIINATEEEKNTVTENKEIFRGVFLTGGLFSGLHTKDNNKTFIGLGLDVSGVNASYGSFRFGVAGVMTHKGKRRDGIKVFGLTDNSTLEEHVANSVVVAVYSALSIFLW